MSSSHNDSLKLIFDSIKTFDDIQALATDTDDGESPTLELKSLAANSFDSKHEGKTKAILSKEICAFLNTNDGLVVWGGGYDKKNKIFILDNKTKENLANYLDKIKLTMIEPVPAGIDFKTLTDADNNSCLLIYVPRSDFAPHRVGSWDADEGTKSKKKITGRYFQRISTSSQVMPENLVRSMYLSKGRIPVVSVHTELGTIGTHTIPLRTIVKPDEQHYIGQYYNSNQIVLVDDMFQEITDSDGSIWREIHGVFGLPEKNPIYPKSCSYELASSLIIDDDEEPQPIHLNGMNLPAQSTHYVDGDIHLTPEIFSRIFAIAAKSNFSCESIPLVEKKRLYILGRQNWWMLPNYRLERSETLSKLEDETGYEIFVASPYQNRIRDDSDAPEYANDGNLRTSGIKNLIIELENHSHD